MLITERFNEYLYGQVQIKRRWYEGLNWDPPKTVQALEEIAEEFAEPQPLFDFIVEHLPTPPSVDFQMEHKTPQFFLRNIPRVERMEEDPDFLPYEEEEVSHAEEIKPSEMVKYERPRFIKYFSVYDVKWLQKVLDKTLRKEVWTDRFSKEIRESLMMGLWMSNPEPIDITRPPFWEDPDPTT